MYWLNGHTAIAGHGTLAEQQLVERGAVLVATLRFDPDPLESTHPGRVVDRVPARAALDRFLAAGVN